MESTFFAQCLAWVMYPAIESVFRFLYHPIPPLAPFIDATQPAQSSSNSLFSMKNPDAMSYPLLAYTFLHTKGKKMKSKKKKITYIHTYITNGMHTPYDDDDDPCNLRKCFTASSTPLGSAPTILPNPLPSLNSINVGIAETPKAPAMSGDSSTSTL